MTPVTRRAFSCNNGEKFVTIEPSEVGGCMAKERTPMNEQSDTVYDDLKAARETITLMTNDRDIWRKKFIKSNEELIAVTIELKKTKKRYQVMVGFIRSIVTLASAAWKSQKKD